MAITDIRAYAHLTQADVEELSRELDAIRADIEESRGERDAHYILQAIRLQRALAAGSRLVLWASRKRLGWILGTAMLAVAKSIENMELGHNIGHGQWDWMNDPEIHSTTWEWDMAGVSSQWRYSHNYRHHMFANVVGVDDDLGFGVLRVTRDQPWNPGHLVQLLRMLVLAIGFEWGIARHGLHSERARVTTDAAKSLQTKALYRKIARQTGKDYLVFPLLSWRGWRRTMAANFTANVARNLWTYLVIFCGHFPDGAEKFTPDVLDGETKPDWYLRQMLGSANFRAGPLLAFMSGNLCYQIEHHLFPDLPSNRYAAMSTRIRALCEKYDLPYATGSLTRQYLQTVRTVLKLSVPNQFLLTTRHDAQTAVAPRQ
ncbi:acyl-CoA desaturase [Mycobacterium cookii]|uniref:fatty acid desaturase family protein n=1 Tax=Mycobacterium cookii TaxID=1775 RepID=UPI0013D664BF|nr:acyl-CoA desaturase [Mycobacterium cookii]MCV7330571.1 acyl-CoA desaturase [Mycobacterium cookii]